MVLSASRTMGRIGTALRFTHDPSTLSRTENGTGTGWGDAGIWADDQAVVTVRARMGSSCVRAVMEDSFAVQPRTSGGRDAVLRREGPARLQKPGPARARRAGR